ncbi:unnamed protein product [Gadus morhua 'NCC']
MRGGYLGTGTGGVQLTGPPAAPCNSCQTKVVMGSLMPLEVHLVDVKPATPSIVCLNISQYNRVRERTHYDSNISSKRISSFPSVSTSASG